MFHILDVTPVLGISVLQPDECSSDISWHMLEVMNDDWLFAPGWHEDLCCFVVIAEAALVEF